ncbi:MAG: Uma2 family endonuclease [Candidatus Schekmanbacteria bacterium]|nr:Uma2 family endonuclease [Candidatus Schekmanbacteria bacterium]
MYALEELATRDDTPQEDHFVVLSGATWEDYERLLAIRGDTSAPRITYLEGILQLMSPSRGHERIISVIGRLVEVWCLERSVEFTVFGSWTLSRKEAQRGVEPDECYVFGEVGKRERPDLAIEVVWTSGGVDKLDVYRKLGVREVWFWRRGAISVHRLTGERYEQIVQSEVLAGIDLEQLVSFLDQPTANRAIREYLRALRNG